MQLQTYRKLALSALLGYTSFRKIYKMVVDYVVLITKKSVSLHILLKSAKDTISNIVDLCICNIGLSNNMVASCSKKIAYI